ncbi:hypothetical protein PMZ80_007503 [Knufia obscura]|uniref:Uncharacterized protein n=1 Tax=Knufia obscura TaxID=1635080 RepID=A0ABR0RIJ3_9EURO|nr:hypothetical protein PMZ80_007503 [Knufia obscura]
MANDDTSSEQNNELDEDIAETAHSTQQQVTAGEVNSRPVLRNSSVPEILIDSRLQEEEMLPNSALATLTDISNLRIGDPTNPVQDRAVDSAAAGSSNAPPSELFPETASNLATTRSSGLLVETAPSVHTTDQEGSIATQPPATQDPGSSLNYGPDAARLADELQDSFQDIGSTDGADSLRQTGKKGHHPESANRAVLDSSNAPINEEETNGRTARGTIRRSRLIRAAERGMDRIQDVFPGRDSRAPSGSSAGIARPNSRVPASADDVPLGDEDVQERADNDPHRGSGSLNATIGSLHRDNHRSTPVIQPATGVSSGESPGAARTQQAGLVRSRSSFLGKSPFQSLTDAARRQRSASAGDVAEPSGRATSSARDSMSRPYGSLGRFLTRSSGPPPTPRSSVVPPQPASTGTAVAARKPAAAIATQTLKKSGNTMLRWAGNLFREIGELSQAYSNVLGNRAHEQPQQPPPESDRDFSDMMILQLHRKTRTEQKRSKDGGQCLANGCQHSGGTKGEIRTSYLSIEIDWTLKG